MALLFLFISLLTTLYSFSKSRKASFSSLCFFIYSSTLIFQDSNSLSNFSRLVLVLSISPLSQLISFFVIEKASTNILPTAINATIDAIIDVIGPHAIAIATHKAVIAILNTGTTSDADNNQVMNLANQIIIGARASHIATERPSKADDISVKAPSIPFNCSFANFSAVPHAFSRAAFSLSILSVPSKNELNAATLLLSVSSNVSARSIPSLFSFFNHATSSGNVSTGHHNAFASFQDPSARFNKIFLVAVPALLASNPALDKTPSNAVVSSKENPNVLATGQASVIAVENFSKSNALFAKLLAITSFTLVASLALSPYIFNVAPTVLAVSPRSCPKAAARFRELSVRSRI
jgi:hypothetical protein